MPTIRISGYAEISDYTKFEKIKLASEAFAEKNGFTFMEVSFEEKNIVRTKKD